MTTESTSTTGTDRRDGSALSDLLGQTVAELRERGNAMRCHPAANGTIAHTEACGELLCDVAGLIEKLAAERDCRTCRHFRGMQHCHSVLRCVDGSSYQRGGVVQLWELAPVDAGF